jgi:hypothetical protein
MLNHFKARRKPMRDPPCNAENSCSMIVGEIKRGCAMLKEGALGFCNEYR